GCAVSLAGAFVAKSWWAPAVLLFGTLTCLASGGYLIFAQKSRGLRKSIASYLSWLGKAQGGVIQRAQQIAAQHQQREEAFRRSKDELNEDLRDYRAEGVQLRRAIVQQGDVQKNEYLRGFLIRDSYKQIPGLTPSHVTL